MSAYDEFVSEFLNANSWAQRKDGVPLDLLDRLTEEEKRQAEQDLLERLDGRDDWPVLGLGHLGSKQAIPKIESLVPTATPALIPALAIALSQLTGSTSLDVDVAKIARDKKIHFGTRIDALYALAKLGTPTGRATMTELFNDPDYLIAYNSKRASGLIP